MSDYNIFILNLKQYLKFIYFDLEVGYKQVGETCGACFDPSNNYHCGTCLDGLECVADPNAELLPDLPSRCRATRSKK